MDAKKLNQLTQLAKEAQRFDLSALEKAIIQEALKGKFFHSTSANLEPEVLAQLSDRGFYVDYNPSKALHYTICW